MRYFIHPVYVLVFAVAIAACGGAASGSTSAPSTAAATNVPQVAATDVPTAAPTSEPTDAPTAAAPPTGIPPTALPPTTATSVASAAATALPPTGASDDSSWTLDIEPVVDGLTRPTFMTHAGDGTNRLFIVEQRGRISILEKGRLRPQPFLDIQSKVTTSGNEQGLLGLAFHPDYKNNGFFFVNYSRKGDGDNVIERYHVSDDANVADAGNGEIVLTIDGFEPNHNGGMLAFGKDGFLYIGTGDGGGGGDNHGRIGHGQALNVLLGKILRIDVNGTQAYSVPPTNPFVNDSAASPEIWAYGLRNPWRFSFDRETGDLYIADVGQGTYEEIDFQAAASGGGENYGWRRMEGNHCYNPRTNCDQNGLVKPIAEYSHDLGCSVTGGYVYRGKQYPWLVGQYIFADYCTGVVWATARDANGTWATRQVTTFDDTISSFGEDQAGELYVIGHRGGTIYKLTSNP